MESIILVALILIVGVLIFLLCNNGSKKSTFTANSESMSVAPKVSRETVFIFYAPWCGHCKSANLEFEKAVQQGQGKIVMIDATQKENETLVKEYNVKGFPTIIKADKTAYRGARKADEIVNFLKIA